VFAEPACCPEKKEICHGRLSVIIRAVIKISATRLLLLRASVLELSLFSTKFMLAVICTVCVTIVC